jgi:TRAP-type C4-dicarboxylate transport system substrate-binding protein
MVKKKKLASLAIISIVLSVFLVVTAASAETRLTFSHFFPASHFVHTRLVHDWVAEVEKATNGQVKFDVFPGSTLLKPAETYEGIVSGTADAGLGVFGYTRGRFPVLEAFEHVGIDFGSATACTLVAVEGVKKFNPKEIQDTKLMVIYSVGPGCLYSNTKINHLTDLKNKRIRATGATVDAIKAMGAVPVAMPMNDAYEALSKGVVDGNIGPPEVLKGWKQADVTKYITVLPPVYNSLQYIVMNLDKWNALPKDVQAAIEKVNEGFHKKAGMIWDDEQKANGIDYGLAQGMQLGRLPDADYQKGMELMQPLIDAYIARMDKAGFPGKEIIDFVKARAEVYRKQFPPGF